MTFANTCFRALEAGKIYILKKTLATATTVNRDKLRSQIAGETRTRFEECALGLTAVCKMEKGVAESHFCTECEVTVHTATSRKLAKEHAAWAKGWNLHESQSSEGIVTACVGGCRGERLQLCISHIYNMWEVDFVMKYMVTQETVFLATADIMKITAFATKLENYEFKIWKARGEATTKSKKV